MPERLTSDRRLTGATAVVTGASRGIGFAVARALVNEGARVAMIARTESQLVTAAQSLGHQAVPMRGDLTRSDEVTSIITRAMDLFHGPPDILVNNAGTFTVVPIDAVNPDAFASELDTNLVAPLRLIRAFLPHMRARRSGHVVTIGSIADRHIFPGNASYAASKFGARALHEVLRLESRGSGVRATLVSPGPVDTPIWDEIDPDNREGFTPRSQMLNANAVADAVVYAVTRPVDVNIAELRLSHT